MLYIQINRAIKSPRVMSESIAYVPITSNSFVEFGMFFVEFGNYWSVSIKMSQQNIPVLLTKVLNIPLFNRF